MKRELKKAFMSGVDGANANLFSPIRMNLGSCLNNRLLKYEDTITMLELYKLLSQVEDKQDKDIDKYMNIDQRLGSK